MERDKLTWDLDDGRVVQIFYTINTEFDLDELVKIDINNLMGEYLTAPVLFNTVANLRTLAMDLVSEKHLQLKVFKQEEYLRLRRELKPKRTKEEMMAMIETSDMYIICYREVKHAEKINGIMDNLYWSIKEKCNKLENMYHKIQPEEFKKEIMEGQVNKMMLKIKEALIK